MELPNNFEEWHNIINYNRNNGVDCLVSLREQLRFYLHYVREITDHKLSLKQINKGGSIVVDKGYCEYRYDLMNLTKYISECMAPSSTITYTKELLFNKLYLASTYDIEKYLIDVCFTGKIKCINDLGKLFTITNTYNDSKIIIPKHLFKASCSYYNMLNDIQISLGKKISTISIPILFDDITSKYVTEFLTRGKSSKYFIPNDIDILQQYINVIEFLGITIYT